VGWRGAGGFASATNACSIWFGGLLLFIAGLFEFILGNDFSFLVFMGYGAHILTFATTFVPSFNAVAFYSDGDPNKATPAFAASFGKRQPNLPTSSPLLTIAQAIIPSPWVFCPRSSCWVHCVPTWFSYSSSSVLQLALVSRQLHSSTLLRVKRTLPLHVSSERVRDSSPQTC
jgi:hypothetical protein